MAYDARSVANELIRRAHEVSQRITILQVIKQVYFCEAWMLGIHDRSMIRQDIIAWRYGPVIVSVYESLRGYGSNPIPLTILHVPEEEYKEDELSIIDQVHKVYGPLTGLQLSALTHQRGTPWHTTWRSWGRNAIIPKTLIRNYYRQKYEAQEQ